MVSGMLASACKRKGDQEGVQIYTTDSRVVYFIGDALRADGEHIPPNASGKNKM